MSSTTISFPTASHLVKSNITNPSYSCLSVRVLGEFTKEEEDDIVAGVEV